MMEGRNDGAMLQPLPLSAKLHRETKKTQTYIPLVASSCRCSRPCPWPSIGRWRRGGKGPLEGRVDGDDGESGFGRREKTAEFTHAGQCVSKNEGVGYRMVLSHVLLSILGADVPEAAHWCWCCCCCVDWWEGRRAGARKAEERDGAKKAKATQSFMVKGPVVVRGGMCERV